MTSKPLGRSIGAVLAGVLYVIATLLTALLVLWLVAPDLMAAESDEESAPPRAEGLLLVIALTVPCGVVGGLVTGYLAPSAPVSHGMALGVVMGLIGLVVFVIQADASPPWFGAGLALGLLVCPPLGGWLRARRTSVTPPS